MWTALGRSVDTLLLLLLAAEPRQRRAEAAAQQQVVAKQISRNRSALRLLQRLRAEEIAKSSSRAAPFSWSRSSGTTSTAGAASFTRATASRSAFDSVRILSLRRIASPAAPPFLYVGKRGDVFELLVPEEFRDVGRPPAQHPRGGPVPAAAATATDGSHQLVHQANVLASFNVTEQLGPSLLGATQSSLAASSFSFDVSNAQEDRFIVYPTAGNSFAVLLPVSVVLQRDIATKRERLVARFESPQFLDLGSASSLRRNVSEAPSIGCDDVADARCSAASASNATPETAGAAGASIAGDKATSSLHTTFTQPSRLRLSQDGRFLYSWRDGLLHVRSRRDGRLTRVVSGLFKNRHSQGAEAAPAFASTLADGPIARLSPSGGPPAAGPGISAATGSNLLLHTENEVGVFGGFSGDWQAGFPCLVGRRLVRKTGSSPVLATRIGELHGKKTKQDSHEITAASVLPGDPEKAVIAFSDGALIVLRLRDRMESSKHSEEGHHYQLHGRPDRSFGRRDRACAVLGHWWLGAGSYGPVHIGGTSTKKRRVVAVAQLALHRHVVLLVTNLGEVAALCMVTRSLQRLFVLPPAPLSEETSVEVLSAEILQERRFLAVHLLLRRGKNASESDALLVSIPRSVLPKCRPPGGAWHAKSSSRRPPNYVPWYQHCYRNPEAAAIFWGLLLLVVCGAYRYQPQPDLENDPEHEEAPRPRIQTEMEWNAFVTKYKAVQNRRDVEEVSDIRAHER